MGLFDAFKKKKEEPKPQNNPNSVFTLRFVVPYFPVFDKTNPKLRAFPVKLSCAGSVQYRIAEPDLCFDNIPLGSMSAGQLEQHVKDSLMSSVKHFINSIDYLPLLQFETELMRINDAAKRYLIPLFADEYGINLRTFTLSRLSYDEEDPNYQKLYAQSSALADKLGEHDMANLEMDHEDDVYEREHRRRQRNLRDDLDMVGSETELVLRRQRSQHMIDDAEDEHDVRQRLRAQNVETEMTMRRQADMHRLSDIESEHEHRQRMQSMRRDDEAYEIEHGRRMRDLMDDESLTEREDNLRLRRQSAEHAMRRNEDRINREEDNADLDYERRRREMEEDMYARRKGTDTGARLSESLGSRPAPSLGEEKKKSDLDGLDLGSL